METKEKLLKMLQEVDFALNEVVLFLDTHPRNKSALNYYKKYAEMHKMLVAEYTRLYGPLFNTLAKAEDYFEWVEDPWPWEVSE